jgi:predicted GTPase
MSEFRCIVLGAAGRDFHDVQTFFKDRPEFRVVAITAAQIPFIERRSFPRELAGPAYEADIPIHLEAELPRLVRELEADFVFLSYSDLSNEEVMHKASLVQSTGAGFALLGPHQTMLRSSKPVVSVTAVRTGAGKSPVTQAIARHLTGRGVRTAVLRHPMPYGDLRLQAVQRFETEEDLARAECTIEEREEYEPYVEAGLVIFAGVDYRAILAAAEREADAVLWDGGNNDYPFVRPDLSIVVADALRPGHEVSYYPGETNLRMADVVVINKVSGATPEAIELVRHHARERCPGAAVVEADLAITVDRPEAVRGKRVLVVEDGPTVTHGGMAYGAGTVAARRFGAGEVVDPRPFAVGTVAEAYGRYPHMGAVLPALGYSEGQRHELEETIRRSGADLVLDASPARLERFLELRIPVVRVRYAFEQRSGTPLLGLVAAAVERRLGRTP